MKYNSSRRCLGACSVRNVHLRGPNGKRVRLATHLANPVLQHFLPTFPSPRMYDIIDTVARKGWRERGWLDALFSCFLFASWHLLPSQRPLQGAHVLSPRRKASGQRPPKYQRVTASNLGMDKIQVLLVTTSDRSHGLSVSW